MPIKKIISFILRVLSFLRRRASQFKQIIKNRLSNQKSLQQKIEYFIVEGKTDKAQSLYEKLSRKAAIDKTALTDFYLKTLFNNGKIEECNKVGLPYGSKVLKLISAEEWAVMKNDPVISAGSIEEIPIANPPLFGSDGFQPAETPAKIVFSAKPYIAELSDVLISSKSSVIVTPDGYALNDVAAHPLYRDFVSLEYDKTILAKRGNYLLMKTDYPVTAIEKGIFLSGLASEYFGHWIPEFLSKLKSYEQHPDFKNTPIIVDENMPQSHFDYLSILIDNPLIRLPEKTAFCCKKLLVAPPATFYPVELVTGHTIPQHEIGPLSPAVLTWIREKTLSRIKEKLADRKSPFGKKLYLSRRNMLWRKASNDEQIADFLAEKGFETIDAEKVSFEDQVLMFRDAEDIVAPNGSSLLNLIFSPPSIKLFVLSQPGIYNWGGYYGPVHALGYEMVFVTGSEAPDAKHANYHVPIETIDAALSRFA